MTQKVRAQVEEEGKQRLQTQMNRLAEQFNNREKLAVDSTKKELQLEQQSLVNEINTLKMDISQLRDGIKQRDNQIDSLKVQEEQGQSLVQRLNQ